MGCGCMMTMQQSSPSSSTLNEYDMLTFYIHQITNTSSSHHVKLLLPHLQQKFSMMSVYHDFPQDTVVCTFSWNGTFPAQSNNYTLHLSTTSTASVQHLSQQLLLHSHSWGMTESQQTSNSCKISLGPSPNIRMDVQRQLHIRLVEPTKNLHREAFWEAKPFCPKVDIWAPPTFCAVALL